MLAARFKLSLIFLFLLFVLHESDSLLDRDKIPWFGLMEG